MNPIYEHTRPTADDHRAADEALAENHRRDDAQTDADMIAIREAEDAEVEAQSVREYHLGRLHLAVEDDDIAAAERAAKAAGYSLNRGSYVGTSDDRIDHWYVERDNARAVDRRGSGYATKREALRDLASWID